MKLDRLKSKIKRTQRKMKEDERIFHSLSPAIYGWDDSICPLSCPEDRDIIYIERHYERLNKRLSKYQSKLLRLTA